MPALTLVLPCYNPPFGWSDNVIAKHKNLEQTLGDDIEVVLVIDGACNNVTDDDIVRLRGNIGQFRLISYPVNKGKGYAIRQGVANASGEIIIYTDIDFPYTDESMQCIYAALKLEDVDIAVGVKGAKYYEQTVFSRKVISKVLRWTIRTFLSMPITDTQCGLKGFRTKVKLLFLQTTINRYLFDLEFVRSGFKNKYTLKPIPVELNKDVRISGMNYRFLLAEVANFIKLLLNN